MNETTSHQNLGYTWCDRCGTYVPDVFTDHAERHAQEGRSILVLETSTFAFWAFCLASGVIAALAVIGLL